MDYDYSKQNTSNGEFLPLDSGEYELTLETAEFKKTKNGKDYISCKFRVRKGLGQKNENRVLFENIWKNDYYYSKTLGKNIKKDSYQNMSSREKEDVEIRQDYNQFKIRKLIQAQDADENKWTTHFGSVEEAVLFVNGMNLRALVNKTYKEDGTERNEIDFSTIQRTKFHSTEATSNVPTVSDESSANLSSIDDEDLPF